MRAGPPSWVHSAPACTCRRVRVSSLAFRASLSWRGFRGDADIGILSASDDGESEMQAAGSRSSSRLVPLRRFLMERQCGTSEPLDSRGWPPVGSSFDPDSFIIPLLRPRNSRCPSPSCAYPTTGSSNHSKGNTTCGTSTARLAYPARCLLGVWGDA